MDTQMINFSIPKALLKKLDAVAKKDTKTRSEALRDAVRVYVTQQSSWEDLFDLGKERAERMNLKQKDVEALVDEVRSGK
jgi:CopG family transcriptional regulator / antitoxin EndoAI